MLKTRKPVEDVFYVALLTFCSKNVYFSVLLIKLKDQDILNPKPFLIYLKLKLYGL